MVKTMNSKEQLDAWVKGDPIHIGDGETGQCCPDFSCCTPETLAPEYERIAFYNADEATRMSMLGTFLARAFENHGNKKIYIAGERDGNAEQ